MQGAQPRLRDQVRAVIRVNHYWHCIAMLLQQRRLKP